mgnify:CR=1 FL=1
MNVRATDKGTGKEHTIRVEQSSSLSEEDIAKMQEDAEKFKEQDETAKQVSEPRNQADQMIYQARKLVKEHEEKVSEEDKTAIEAKADSLEEALKGDDATDFNVQMEELQTLLTSVGENIYKATAAEGQTAQEPAPQEESAGDEVVDADYEVKD